MNLQLTSNALIGFTGFVGSSVMKQRNFNNFFRSSNIHEIQNRNFDFILCAGAPAQKWIANQNPTEDLEKIKNLIEYLSTVQCKKFVLISTVDVFKNPSGVDELSGVTEEGLHPYGLHRRYLEKFVQNYFDSSIIVRLPGLVGPGLRKNIIFDFLNGNNLNGIESRSIFQFYPIVNLWYDIEIAINAGLDLLHLTAEPISIFNLSKYGFGKEFNNVVTKPLVMYDMRTIHSKIFGVNGHYQYTSSDTIQAVRSYAQSEMLFIKPKSETPL